MADQELGLRFKTTSDVPEQVGKAKSAVVSFAKQVEDIQKKFSTAFKDIFLGFTAPMVLLNSAISYISGAIDKAKQDAKEGLDLIAKGETVFASSEEARTAAFFKRRKEIEEERRLVSEGKASLTEQILMDSELAKGFKLPRNIEQRLSSGESVKSVSKDLELQRMAMDYLSKTEKGRKILQESTPTEATKAGAFKTPEGFSNVVGVGSNPVIEAMNEQLEEQRKQTALLEKIASPDGGVPKDFTKDTK